jgi:hypothetical protein
MAKFSYNIEVAELYYPLVVNSQREWKFKEVYAVYKNGRYIRNFHTYKEAKAQVKIWEKMYAHSVQNPVMDTSLDCGNPSCKCSAKQIHGDK